MSYIHEMLKTHPMQAHDARQFAECIEACGDCLEACNACADACLGEENVDELRRCIRLNNDCADLCDSAMRIMSRQTETEFRIVRSAIDAMAIACRYCGEECARHAKMHQHCRVCADACTRCEQTCRRMMDSLPMAA